MSSALEQMRARLAALRSQSPPTGVGEIRRRTPVVRPAKPPDAAGRVLSLPPAPAARRETAVPAPTPSPFELPTLTPGTGTNGLRRNATLNQKQLRSEQLRDVRLNGERPSAPPNEGRPMTRGDCFGGERPCPYVSCRYHTYLDVTPNGSLVINRPDVDVTELKASCSLDIADDGPKTLEQVGAVFNVTRERMRQVETAALRKVKGLVEPKPDGEVRFRKQCKAVDAFTGRRCGLLEHPDGSPHRSERGEFRVAAAPGQTRFELRERLDEQAKRNPESMPALEASHV